MAIQSEEENYWKDGNGTTEPTCNTRKSKRRSARGQSLVRGGEPHYLRGTPDPKPRPRKRRHGGKNGVRGGSPHYLGGKPGPTPQPPKRKDGASRKTAGTKHKMRVRTKKQSEDEEREGRQKE